MKLDTYENFSNRFIPFMLMKYNDTCGLDGEEQAIQSHNLMMPFVRATLWCAMRMTKDMKSARRTIEASRCIFQHAADLTYKRYASSFVVIMDLDATPYVEPLDYKRPFPEAMNDLIDRLEADYIRFGEAKDMDAIHRLILTYEVPIGQWIGLSTKPEHLGDQVNFLVEHLLMELDEYAIEMKKRLH